MFAWWISWLWAWVCLWACAGVEVSSMWSTNTRTITTTTTTNNNNNRPTQSQQPPQQPILPPSHLGAPQVIGSPLNAPGRLQVGGAATGGKQGAQGGRSKSELGPGMGGSAVQTLEGKEGAQYFATQPTPQTAVVGSTAVLPCRVINKVGHLQWTRDGFGLGTGRELSGFSRYKMIGSDDEGDFSLRIQPVMLEDDAIYQCQVSASMGIPGIRSHTARLTVYVPPEPPRVKPPLLSTTAGMTVTLECESRGGRPPPEIQWVDDSKRETLRTGTSLATKPMEDGKRVTVRSRLSFTPSRFHHNSSLTCLTSNQALSSPLSSSIQLSVLFPPEVKLQARPPHLTEGDDATFFCTADANPAVITYKWYHNNQELVNQTTRTLLMPKISRNMHQNTISCEVSNTVGTSKKTQSIHVQYGPHFRALPRDVMAETGKDVELKCDVDANPPASIVWLQEGSDKIVGSGEELTVEVGPKSAGVYSCVAAVRGFPDLKGSLRVLVKGPPTIVSSGEQLGRKGDTVTLECITVSIPSPIRITWTYNGRDIDLSDPRYEVVQDEQEEKLRNILVIHDADTKDFGAYNCSVVNEYGVARKQIRLNEEKTVPVVLVVGGVVAVVVVAVVVASLVLCNKRHSNIKGSPVPEKPPTLTVVPGPPVANMYSAPSDTKLSEGLGSSPALSTGTKHFDQATPTPDEGKLRTVQALKRLSGDSSPHTFIPDPDSEGGRGYVPFVDYTGRDYAPMPNGRRASISDLGPFTSTPHLHNNHTPADHAPDFCTIRRGTRGPDLARGVDLVRGTDIIRGADLATDSLIGSNYHHHEQPPVLRHNGTATTLSRHSVYSAVRTYGSPPPPPYPRNSKIGSPRAPASPSLLPSHHDEITASPEAKFIFSPEAMMKPGTLV